MVNYVLRASSSGFAWGTMVFTKHKTACLRKILIQSRSDTSEPIDPKYTRLGKLNEDRHEKRLDAHLPYVREREFVMPVNGTAVTLKGHADYVITDLEGNVVRVDELKSVSSVNTRREVIRNGQFVPENLAQLVTYMAAFDAPVGRLIYTFYPEGSDTPNEERTFVVTIDDFSRINVDGAPTKFTYFDLLAHRDQAALAIDSGDVPQRPHLWDAPFVSPCKFCQYAHACEAYDLHDVVTPDDFVLLAKGPQV